MKKNRHVAEEEKIKAVLSYKDGELVSTIAKIFKQTNKTIYNWINEFSKNNSLERKPGSGRPQSLSLLESRTMLKYLKKPASDFGFETDLWNTSRIKIIVKKKLKKDISRMAIWRILDNFEYSFKKVQKEYREVDKDKQNIWKIKTIKEIKKVVKKHRAILYFEDESNIQLSPVMGKSWAPIGEKITHKVTSHRGSVAAISAISNDGRLIFNLFDHGKRFKSDDIIDFLQKMLDHHKRRHLVVVMDQAPCHTSKKVIAFVESQKRLHVYYLPPRSPEFNPDEQVWGYLKHHQLKSHKETTTKDLKKLARKKLKSLSKDKHKLLGIYKRCDNHFLYQ
jgi:transposase